MYAAISTGSLSLFATAADAFMDLVSSCVMLVTSRLAARPSVYKYPVGRTRIETIGIIMFCCLMTTVAIQLIIESGRALGGGAREAEELHIIPIAFVATASEYLEYRSRVISPYTEHYSLRQGLALCLLLHLPSLPLGACVLHRPPQRHCRQRFWSCHVHRRQPRGLVRRSHRRHPDRSLDPRVVGCKRVRARLAACRQVRPEGVPGQACIPGHHARHPHPESRHRKYPHTHSLLSKC